MSHPRLSVLLPLHNAAEDCEGVFGSLLSQTFEDFELIVLDDGSEDDTLKRVKAFKDGRIRILERPHEGLTSTLCQGLLEARGDLVARQDADDRSRPDRFARQVAYLAEHDDVALVGSGVRVVDPAGRDLGQYTYPTDHEALVRELWRLSNPLPHTTILFRRQAVNGCGGYRRCFIKAQDFDLYLRLSEHYRLGSIPEPLCDLQHSLHSITARVGDGAQFEYGVLALVAAESRRAGRPDPLDHDAADFIERYRAWYRQSRYPATFRSRLLRRAARLAWADSRPALAALAFTRSLWVDPWWAGERLGVVPPGRIAADAVNWARIQTA